MTLSRNVYFAWVLVLGMIFAGAGAGWGQSGVVRLAVVAGPGQSSAAPGTYHFRPEEADSGQGISHAFILKNDTGNPVTIVRIDSSCSCTTALLQGAASTPTSTGETTLSPGQQVQLRVTVGIGDAAAGEIDKTVWVRVAGQADPAATLHVVGTIDPPVMFAPTSIDFGAIPAGEPRHMLLRVGFSPRVPGGPAARLTSSLPYLVVTPEKAGSGGAGAFPPTYTVQEYEVAVPADAPIGPLDSTLGLSAAPAGPAAAPAGALVFGMSGSAPQAAPAPVPSLPAAGVQVRGDVVGDLAATPETAIFGTVAAGAGASVPVTITSRTGKNLAAMRFTSDQPWLSAQIAGPGKTWGSWVLQLTIAAGAPAGAQTGHVLCEVAGERLSIPVMAYIVSER